jgi:hypothetical protein
MAKKRSITSYDKLTPEQKRQLIKDFPDGYRSNVTTIKTPAGETLEALIWETEEVIYLIKISKTMTQALDDDDDDDDDFDDDFTKLAPVKGVVDEDEDLDDDDDDDSYDTADDDEDDDDED